MISPGLDEPIVPDAFGVVKLDDTRRHRLYTSKPWLRRFPFPFLSALAIVNDPRGMTFNAWRAWHRAFQKKGLEIGDCLPFGPDGAELGLGKTVRGLMDCGYIYGVAGMPAKGLGALADWCQKKGFRPKFYVGDPPVAEALGLSSLGVRYFTDPAWRAAQKFGEHIDYRIQAKLDIAREGLMWREFDEPRPGVVTDPWNMAINADDPLECRLDIFNGLGPYVQTPEGAVKLVKTYAGPQAPARNTFPLQLRGLTLDRFEREGGAIIVGQRLGWTGILGDHRSHGYRLEPSSHLSLDEMLTIEELASRVAVGKLMVATPVRLLDWLERRRRLKYSSQMTATEWIVRIEGLTATTGEVVPLTRDQIHGLAFTVPSEAPQVRVEIVGMPRVPKFHRASDAIFKAHDSVYLPWEPLACPKI